jgi:hypothetical protein
MLTTVKFLQLALVVALVGSLPLAIPAAFAKTPRKRATLAATAGVVSLAATIVMWPLFYFELPALYQPWWGMAGTCVWILWVLSATIAAVKEHALVWVILFPIVLTIIWAISWVVRGTELFNADKYGGLIGHMEVRTWTQDIQPKSAEHVRTNSNENAAYMAKQALGQAGAIGSQFKIGEAITQQKIRGDFWYVVPLDHMSWTTWRYTRTIPAYVRVSGQDPSLPAELLRLPIDEQLRYTPSAFWNDNLERHLWAHGYANTGLIEFVPEVDESNKLWYVVTTFQYAINAWAGRRATGVLVIDPVTGSIKQELMEALDDWLDRVIPPELIQQNIRYKGLYPEGDYWNTVGFGIGARKGLTEPEASNLVYGSDNNLYWVTGVTALSNADHSLIGLYYSSTRTGKTIYYQTNGSADVALVAAIDKHRDVQYRHLHGVSPQIYNIAGAMTAIIPMMNGNDAFQGLGFVNVKNLQIMAFSPKQDEAYEAYLVALAEAGHRLTPDAERRVQPLEGTVDRFVTESNGTETTFYFHIKGINHIFSGNNTLSNKLRLTQIGDHITGLYVATGAEVEPLRQFDNESLVVERGKAPGGIEPFLRGKQ